MNIDCITTVFVLQLGTSLQSERNSILEVSQTLKLLTMFPNLYYQNVCKVKIFL